MLAPQAILRPLHVIPTVHYCNNDTPAIAFYFTTGEAQAQITDPKWRPEIPVRGKNAPDRAEAGHSLLQVNMAESSTDKKKDGKKFEVKKWNAVALWAWGTRGPRFVERPNLLPLFPQQ